MTIKIDHINITVNELAASVDWYGKVFGFKLVESGKTAVGGNWGIVAINDTMVCMTEFSGHSTADKATDKSAHKINHFGIRISNLEQWQKTVEDNQLKLYYGGVIEYPNSKSWYVHDPSGHEIEISYTVKEHLQFPTGGIQ